MEKRNRKAEKIRKEKGKKKERKKEEKEKKPCLPSGLLCLNTAKEGGLTSWSSSGSIYNRLLQSHPDYVQVCVMHSNSQEIDC